MEVTNDQEPITPAPVSPGPVSNSKVLAEAFIDSTRGAGTNVKIMNSALHLSNQLGIKKEFENDVVEIQKANGVKEPKSVIKIIEDDNAGANESIAKMVYEGKDPTEAEISKWDIAKAVVENIGDDIVKHPFRSLAQLGMVAGIAATSWSRWVKIPLAIGLVGATQLASPYIAAKAGINYSA